MLPSKNETALGISTISAQMTRATTPKTNSGNRIYQAHLTHVVLVPCEQTGENETYIVKRWSQFYGTMEYQDQ